MAIPAAMGTAIAINFQPTGEGKAAITGDFVALAGEVESTHVQFSMNGEEFKGVGDVESGAVAGVLDIVGA